MRNIVKKTFSLLMTLTLFIGLSTTSFATESVGTFEDGKLIAFEPGSVYTDTDLFDNFKGVMPGDTRVEKVTIRNESGDFDYIKVYLRAVLYDEAGNPISPDVLDELRNDERRGETSELAYMIDFLSQLSMTVKNGAEEIYDVSAGETGSLIENVYLGTLRKGEALKLNVELGVPIELGNEYANRIGEVDWVFAVDGFEDSDSKPAPEPDSKPTPDTGSKPDPEPEVKPAPPIVSLIQTGQLNWPIPVLCALGFALIACGLRKKTEG